ncbi:tRNA pseudouridine(55) synthase TruB [bacterium]|nr:tRNA pseudouridine(55) synthase TruB [bacterium]
MAILNVNKPINWTSFDVVAKYRNISGVKKVGHAGTLDPLATGVLLLLTGKDRKNQQNLMGLDKEYEAEVMFGATSPTYDLEGRLSYCEQKPILDEVKKELPDTIKKYIGQIQQTIPPYSAKKVKGTPMYKLARKGKISEKELPTKTVTINSIKILDYFEKDNLPVVRVRISCSSGTYIRSLARDFGTDLGCGGVLASLVRTKVGEYSIKDSKSVASLE